MALTPVERLGSGRAALARALKRLLTRNSLSHADLKSFLDWAEPDQRTWLSTSQISGLRTQKLIAAGPRVFDSFGQVNLRLAQLAGHQSPRVRALSPLPPGGLPASVKHLRDAAWFLSNPATGQAMAQGDLFEVWLGRLDPDIADEGYSDREARAICERVALLAQGWLAQNGMLPSQGRPALEKWYKGSSKARRDRLWTTLMGGTALKGEDLVSQQDDLMALIGGIAHGQPLTLQQWDRWLSTGVLPSSDG